MLPLNERIGPQKLHRFSTLTKGAEGGFWPVADARVAGPSVRIWIKFRRQ
jgi:hypothetical protein